MKVDIEIIVKSIEKKNTYQFAQKAILAIFKTWRIYPNFDLFVKMTIAEAKNPRIKPSPTRSVPIELDCAKWLR
jgi:hypothetical protein